MQLKDIAIFNETPSGNPSPASVGAYPMHDRLGRPLRDLRISVTDRCNLRCIYCMPDRASGKNFQFIPHPEILTFEEISRLAHLFTGCGVEKIRLTGGEPLLRPDIEILVEKLAHLKTVDGRDIDLTMTTNGTLLAAKAHALYEAGLKRITVSLDALNDGIYRQMNGVNFPVDQVLNGIGLALQAGFSPVKINMVVKKGINDQEILPLARYFRNTPVIVRFIEYMDVGMSNGWTAGDTVTSDELVSMIHAEMPLESLAPHQDSDTAARFRYRDGTGEIGVISSISKAFCGNCTRLRLSTTGKLYTCLFAESGTDLKEGLRNGWSDAQITHTLTRCWQNRDDRYSQLRESGFDTARNKIEMSYIGG